MRSVNQLLDDLKSAKEIGSDYKLSMYLGVVPGSVKNWRHGRSLPDSRATTRIANELGIDPDVLLLEIEAQRAPSEFAKDAWLRIAERLQGGAVHSALLAILVVLGFITTPPNAYAVVTSPATISAAASEGLYIMSNSKDRNSPLGLHHEYTPKDAVPSSTA